MTGAAPLTFKIATEDWEFEQIHRLNYRTFVEEIPQHERNSNNILVDKFDRENTYLICLRGTQLLGMMTVRANRPFSLDSKVENLDSYLPPGRTVCEIRLLSVEREHRGGRVFVGLVALLAQYCKEQGYDLAVISGTVRQIKLYKHVGFVPFGPRVGTRDALFQPMYVTMEDFEAHTASVLGFPLAVPATRPPVNLLPGPVDLSDEVREAFQGAPVSHRSEAFVADVQRTKRLLCDLVQADSVQLLMGSGTVANDAIAGQLSLLPGCGIVLGNGEFGERLIDHATRFGLAVETLRTAWGEPFDIDQVAELVDGTPDLSWLWAVHSETSTGVLNDAPALKRLTDERGIRLCLDCISSIGTLPVDLRNVYLASGVSGKGLGALPGLSMVFADHELRPSSTLPRYLDLGLYAGSQGVPFTLSSNLVYALRAALERGPFPRRFAEIAAVASWLRVRLSELGLRILVPEAIASPAVLTVVLPDGISSELVGDSLGEAGYLVSYRSRYLLERNWIQLCLMGDCPRERLLPLAGILGEILQPVPAS
jgi:aspartate aminotransferase-like enzyme